MKGIVLITYRDRFTHLNCLVPYLNKFYSELRVAVIEQADASHWNKGLLYNAGYRELAQDYDYIILHDVDWIPVVGRVDYRPCAIPNMIGAEASQFNYHLNYPAFFGGVVVCSKEHYEAINGFSNMFRGWGGEDDLFHNSFRQKGIPTGIKPGRFECFQHTHMDIAPGGRDYNNADYQHNLRLCTTPRDFNEGLSTATYKVLDRRDHSECIHLKINTTTNNI